MTSRGFFSPERNVCFTRSRAPTPRIRPTSQSLCMASSIGWPLAAFLGANTIVSSVSFTFILLFGFILDLGREPAQGGEERFRTPGARPCPEHDDDVACDGV